VGVYIYKSEYGSEHRKAVCTGREHRNAMSEHRTGTGTRIRTGTGTGTKIEREILRAVLLIPEFECRTKFWESREPV